ncbi:MAG TPA: ribosome maturation factor RimM [Gaiellales bacterium]|nr:ribosome maturation factor RimM [Gaiellales bacterium]
MSRSPASRRDWRPDRIVLGRIGRAHGLDGSVYLDGHGGAVTLVAGMSVRVGERPAVLVSRRGMTSRPLLRIDLAGNRDQAEALRGLELWIPAAELPEPEPGEYFHVDLIGCRVVAGDRTLGEVRDVLGYPANDVLVVAAEGGDLLLPFVDTVVLEVDVPGRRITVDGGVL